jgi:hypothetical protein
MKGGDRMKKLTRSEWVRESAWAGHFAMAIFAPVWLCGGMIAVAEGSVQAWAGVGALGVCLIYAAAFAATSLEM